MLSTRPLQPDAARGGILMDDFGGIVWALALGFGAALAGCGAPPETGRTTSDIVGGAKATAYPEVVIISLNGTGKYCSGTIIAPRVVLTAGHCIAQANKEWEVTAPYLKGPTQFSSSASTYDYTAVTERIPATQHDVGLIFVPKPFRVAKLPSIAKSPLSDGASIVNIGRVIDGKISHTDLYVSKPVTTKSGGSFFHYPYDYVAEGVTQSGDSGGPAMRTGTHTIVAVNSAKDFKDTEYLARVDLVFDWIQTQIANHGGGGATATGTSGSGGTATGTSGTLCAHSLCTDGDMLEATCDPCASSICSVDPYCCSTAWDPQCVSEVQVYCGNSCDGGEASSSSGGSSESGGTTDDCGDVTYEGTCDGSNVLWWCDGGTLNSLDCDTIGSVCDWNVSAGYYDCM
ncbi:MAG TPA: trypsin-like serine protease [Polyangiaceae bacterium]|nr:trypsin-like serine protease [Polyangiaceae bacterium]